jgi:hypothetical protein
VDFAALACSLDDPRFDEDGERATLGDVISEEEVITLCGRMPRGCIEAIETKLHMEAVIATLPPVLRELCHALMNQTVGEVSASSGIPRTTIASRIKLMRRVFEDAGLGKSTSFRRNRKSSHM